VESGIEYGYLGNRGKDFLDGTDAAEIGGVMERSEVAALVDDRFNFGGYELALENLCTSVEHAVANSIELIQTLHHAMSSVSQGFKHGLNSFGMVGEGFLKNETVFGSNDLMFEDAVVGSDSFYDTLGLEGEFFIALHVKQLILERGASTVEY